MTHSAPLFKKSTKRKTPVSGADGRVVGYGRRTVSLGSGGVLAGDRRCLVACSKAYASPINLAR